LRKHAGRALSARIIAEIPKDLAHRPTDDIANAIAEHRA
jgi:protein required for attachment to host cells